MFGVNLGILEFPREFQDSKIRSENLGILEFPREFQDSKIDPENLGILESWNFLGIPRFQGSADFACALADSMF